MFESARPHWIMSSQRKQFEDSIAASLSSVLRNALPLIPKAVIEACVNLVMFKVDQMIAAPVEIQGGKVVVNDHR